MSETYETPTLKTPEQHNRERRQLHDMESPWRVSGVACPQCGEELLVDTSMSLTSDPPQHRSKCPKCGHTGYLVA
jgi:predicted RNA-binding Zn-ribbon protein involved in translation (DUF1610 family)